MRTKKGSAAKSSAINEPSTTANKQNFSATAQVEKACANDPNLRKTLNVRTTTGKPPIEYDQPFLMQTIIDLALQGSAAMIDVAMIPLEL